MTRSELYRLVWRWHFFAGIIVLPILAWMAATGGLYLYQKEIERALYHDWVISGSIAAPMRVSDMVEQVEAQTNGPVRQVVRPAVADESWRMTYRAASGESRMAFVRPDVGLVLGTASDGGPMALIARLHSLTVAGTLGNVVVEIVAGWGVLLVLTGFFLWWPRVGYRALSLAGRVGERRFWRNLHASVGALVLRLLQGGEVGALVGALILFLAVTGMPWSIFWGERFHALVAQQEVGRPASPTMTAPGSHADHDRHLPWSVRGQPQPRASRTGDIGPDRAIAAAARHGLTAPWVIDLPTAPGQAYRVSAVAERTGDLRILHVDPASGAILQDVDFDDFGIGARAFEWGIYTHMGQQFGEANRLILLIGAIGLLLLALSAPVMWWKRRGRGGLRAPPAPAGSAHRGLIGLFAAVGVLFPLTGLSMLAALGLATARARLTG